MGVVSGGPRIVQLLVSPVHRYEGRPSDGPAPEPGGEQAALVDAVEIREGLGVVGDRYFGKRAHRDASVTVMAAEVLAPGVDLLQTRRNVLLSGVDVDALVGRTLVLDSGFGAVVLDVRRRANPCGWLDTVIAPGSRKALAGKGGVRCVPLSSGRLVVGPVHVEVCEADDAQ